MAAAAAFGLALPRCFFPPDPDFAGISMWLLKRDLRRNMPMSRRWNCSPMTVDRSSTLRVREMCPAASANDPGGPRRPVLPDPQKSWRPRRDRPCRKGFYIKTASASATADYADVIVGGKACARGDSAHSAFRARSQDPPASAYDGKGSGDHFAMGDDPDKVWEELGHQVRAHPRGPSFPFETRGNR